MANFDAILEGLHNSSKISDTEPKPIIIDNKRNFIIPEGYNLNLAHEGDVNSQIVTFALPKSQENHSLSACQNKKIKWKNLNNGIEGVSSLLDANLSTEYSNEYFGLKWEVEPELFSTASVIEISITLYDIKNNKLAFSWNTPTYKGFYVSESFDTIGIGEIVTDVYIPAKDEILFIDEDTRKIVAPKGYNYVVANLGDRGTSKVYFQTKRVIRGIDLTNTNTNITIHYNIDGNTGNRLINTETEVFANSINQNSNDLITFCWDIGPDITNNNWRYSGSFSFTISFSNNNKNWITSSFDGLIIGNTFTSTASEFTENKTQYLLSAQNPYEGLFKTVNGVVQLKAHTLVDWETIDYIPQQNELVVVLPATGNDIVRIRVGDGVNAVKNLENYTGAWIQDGSGDHAIVTNDIKNNVASGEYSRAGGYQTQAYGDYSHAGGRDALTLSESAFAHGGAEGKIDNPQNIAGTKGYYFKRLSATQIQLYQDTDRTKVIAPSNWKKGDRLSFTNKSKYINTNEISSISGNTVTLTSALPFTEEKPSVREDFEDYSVTNINYPNEGPVDLGRNAVAFGEGNAVISLDAFAAGRENKVIGQYGAAFGRGNTVEYAGFSVGRYGYATEGAFSAGSDCEAKAPYSISAGYKCTTDGAQTGIALGQECKARACGAVALGSGVWTNYSADNGSQINAEGGDLSSIYRGQVVVGRYNADPGTNVFVVGAGKNDWAGQSTSKPNDNRFNALEVSRENFLINSTTTTRVKSSNIQLQGATTVEKSLRTTGVMICNSTLTVNGETNCNGATIFNNNVDVQNAGMAIKYINNDSTSKAGKGSLVVGQENTANVAFSIVTGKTNTSDCNYTYTFGMDNRNRIKHSFIAGRNNQIGPTSGSANTTTDKCIAAIGYNLRADDIANQGQVIIGRNNVAAINENDILIVGGGTDGGNRKNVFTVSTSGVNIPSGSTYQIGGSNLIVNSLTNTSTTRALSAAQGKILNDRFNSYATKANPTFTGTLTLGSVTLTATELTQLKNLLTIKVAEETSF